MSEEPEQMKIEESGGDALATVGDAIADLATGIPAPIRKNALKAFTRLCTAAVEYPVVLIEGAIAEKRAESQARVKLIDASAKQIAEQMKTDISYAHAAASKFAQKIVRERMNVDQVAGIAAADMKSQTPAVENDQESEAPSISEDWLNAFENEAAQMSSEQMQRLFGKILAGEIRRPSSYSIRTLKVVAQLDNHAAELFRRLCSLSISLAIPNSNDLIDARVVSLGKAAHNSLQAYGLGFGELVILQEYGLIISDYDSYRDYTIAVAQDHTVRLPMLYRKEQWGLVPKNTSSTPSEFRIEGVSFSQVGKELLPIVDIEPNEQYTTALNNFFDQRGMVMTRVR